MNAKSIEAKVEELMDREKIKETISKYCFGVDRGGIEDLDKLFHQDAVLIIDPWGTYKGKAAIKEFYQNILQGRIIPSMRHLVHNFIIEIKGDEATACSYFDVTSEKDEKAVVGGGFYEHRLVRQGDSWQFIEKKIKIDFMVPLEKGWGGKEKITPL